MYGIVGNKMFAHMDRVLHKEAQKPITADVFLTNYCNNKCPYCTYRRWELDEDAYSMKYEDFVRYAEQLVFHMGVKGIILTGGGEPTICKDFDLITKWLEDRKIPYGVNTNFNVLKYIKPRYLKVSLDAWDEDSYEERRGVRRYEQVRENIQKYAEWKRKESPRTTLGIQRVVAWPDDVYQFYKANCDLDVDYIVFRPIESTRGAEYLNEYAADHIAEAIYSVKELAKKDSRVQLNFKWNLIGEQERTCTAQWAQIAVNERGQVMYCCHKPYQIVGHVLDPDIISKKEMACTDMKMCDIPCRMTAPNKLVSEIMRSKGDHAPFI